ncbi:hypothetical protein ALO_14742 [Acetonema longum DSM 6540]|uniref:Uncharacterized protein n=1 Tax=Acetonema longum DSM 6540 TaxID=1009370 RepID=F7NLH6_9FIRM|nr:hypothetical protein ALO_14742 [Acetonema longum DSM 6540]
MDCSKGGFGGFTFFGQVPGKTLNSALPLEVGLCSIKQNIARVFANRLTFKQYGVICRGRPGGRLASEDFECAKAFHAGARNFFVVGGQGGILRGF